MRRLSPGSWCLRIPVPIMLALGLACAPQQATVPAAAKQGPATVDPKQAWVLSGVLRQVGNYPHIEMVISGCSESFGKGDYFVTGPLRKELAALAPGRISVKGTVLRKELALAGSSGKMRLRLEVEVTEYAR